MIRFILKNYLITLSVVLSVISYLIYKIYIPHKNQSIFDFLQGYLFFNSVIIYLISLETLRAALHNLKKYDIRFHQNIYNNNELKLLSLICAFPFGLGVSAFLRGIANGKIDTLPVSQGMTLSMVLYPTTLASGYILDYFHMNSIFDNFIYGLPIVLIMMFDDQFTLKINIFFNKLTFFIIFLGIINLFYIHLISMLFEFDFLIKQAIFFIFISFLIDKSILTQFLDILSSIKQKIVFFMCIGLFGTVIFHFINNFNVNFDVNFFLFKNIVIIFPIVIVPIIGILMIHPLILFIIFSPLITPCLIDVGFSGVSIYIIWIIMLINSQLLSPVSLTTIINTHDKNHIFLESFIKHYKFFIKLSVISIIYINAFK